MSETRTRIELLSIVLPDNKGLGVTDRFSDIVAALEERGCHANAGMGACNLPNRHIPVEMDVIVAVRG